MVSVAPGAPKPAGNPAFRGYKNSWVLPQKHVPFHWPISHDNRRGTPFSIRSTRTYDVKEFDLHQFWCKLSP